MCSWKIAFPVALQIISCTPILRPLAPYPLVALQVPAGTVITTAMPLATFYRNENVRATDYRGHWKEKKKINSHFDGKHLSCRAGQPRGDLTAKFNVKG